MKSREQAGGSTWTDMKADLPSFLRAPCPQKIIEKISLDHWTFLTVVGLDGSVTGSATGQREVGLTAIQWMRPVTRWRLKSGSGRRMLGDDDWTPAAALRSRSVWRAATFTPRLRDGVATLFRFNNYFSFSCSRGRVSELVRQKLDLHQS
ncbi:hypothetical protein T4D_14791 [Trichinella pseudospiralis]|uniref:Uncharacterized protein n=1 Tax=Trichinella pseudospiralis TaxID=6337 RepID=A0A0V1FQ49_TRIPS|nr:hypothetical protein T4D_14791 [Trichinella pseudospiralis]